MSLPYDNRLIMVVAQQPFSPTHKYDKFCKLIPLAYADGTPIHPGEFPNDGEIWWMLTPQSERLATPGRLVTGYVEDAVRFDSFDPVSSRFQAKRESIHELSDKEGLSIVDIPAEDIHQIQDVVNANYRVMLRNRPTSCVMLRWRNKVYGPFTVIVEPDGITGNAESFLFVPRNAADQHVYCMDTASFSIATQSACLDVLISVSRSDNHRSVQVDMEDVRCELLLPAGLDRMLASNPTRLSLESLERKLLRLAKQVLAKKKRQELQRVLTELEPLVREAENAEELLSVTGQMKALTESQEIAIDVMAKALLESGVLGDDRIARAEKVFAEKFLEERKAELHAKAEEYLTGKREETRRVEADLKTLQGRLQLEEAQRKESLQRELDVLRLTEIERFASERQEFEKQREELTRQQTLLKQNLEKVTKDLREAGDDVVNRFLTIAPLFGAIGLTSDSRTGSGLPSSPRLEQQEPAPEFHLPGFISGGVRYSEDPLKEEEFFDRFRRIVEESGFTYRNVDLRRFHLSVKCNEITILGGPSGTGKSSLPALYAQALLGAEAEGDRPGCLMINVNPSWMDTRDVVGHLNTLDGRFYPAESGLFQHLIFAQEEYLLHRAASGVYLTCLDEMNLAQVEHYFGDFMMILDRSISERSIQCFSTSAAPSNCQFRRWGRISLSPALRFVGTVNFDETTRLLSNRLLDRVNLINIESKHLPGMSQSGRISQVAGRMVTIGDLDDWKREGALPPALGSLLDEMRPLLHDLGCPISPRVYRGICRFVASAGHILRSDEAFDIQVSQRIIPKIRSLTSKRQRVALDSFARLLSSSTVCSFEESQPLLQEARDIALLRGWDLEE